ERVLLPVFFLMLRLPLRSTLFPYTTLFRSRGLVQISSRADNARNFSQCDSLLMGNDCGAHTFPYIEAKNKTAKIEHEATTSKIRSEEHTSELQSRENLVCRLLLEKKKTQHK